MLGLRSEKIQSSLDRLDLSFPVELNYVERIDSTNRWLRENLVESGSDRILCVADEQTAGVGRSGRRWVSPAGGNIYMSLSMPLALPVSDVAAFSLVVALCLVEVLEELGVSGMSVKWPNDVLLDEKKLAGILLEIKPVGGRSILIIGIGINVKMDLATDVVSELGWNDLAQAGADPVDREELIANLVASIQKAEQQYNTDGFTGFAERYRLYDGWAGRLVNVMDAGIVRFQGLVVGVNNAGQMLIDTANGQKVVQSGELSLRLDKSGIQ